MTEIQADVVLGNVAHGGWCVARIDGKVTFISGGLPGERVDVEVTEHSKRFDRGRVTRVLNAHDERVPAPCPVAGICGGCDWQHASPALQLDLKRRVVAEQLQRLAGLEWSGQVHAVTPFTGWRTRMQYSGSGDGLGLRARRSHDVVALPDGGCRIAASQAPAVLGERVEVVEAASGRVVLVDGHIVEGAPSVQERAAGRDYTVDADGFWQIHPQAANTLVHAVLDGLKPQAGESAVDLYCGVGLFAGALAGAGCDVLGVEVNKRAVLHARRNVPEARFEAAPVEQFLHRLPKRADLVVMDPPRKGAGKRTVQAVAKLQPRRVAYVACDPSALARDLSYFSNEGYAPQRIDAFDLFPQTHHVECVAILVPA
ncbi:class I SAM-dependent RNA methyltransferase [uncultured Tessaracoccus sp.]|uniref:class I SAM-dependent RNA methyltransferase n=1 Tax=uncultured Tessaracoccus sp. TaxID=905023 RepID=UPI002638926A|nr:TRAM domain-containing protein [uncultured Tessaracoccus sp.]